MFSRASTTQLKVPPLDRPEASPLRGFLRRAGQAAAPATAAADADFTPDPIGGFEDFGRAGLQIGGLHRDRQWVGAWGGSC